MRWAALLVMLDAAGGEDQDTMQDIPSAGTESRSKSIRDTPSCDGVIELGLGFTPMCVAEFALLCGAGAALLCLICIWANCHRRGIGHFARHVRFALCFCPCIGCILVHTCWAS